jgi:hypothetical protein
MKRPVRLVELFPGSTQVAVYRPPNKEPHFMIVGAPAADLDVTEVANYMYECDWVDRGSEGWITPELRCDDFMAPRVSRGCQGFKGELL